MAETCQSSLITKLQNLILGDGNSGSWADLPGGVLCEIYTRVYAVDQYSFRSVCKSWNNVHSLTSLPFQFPQNKSDRQTPYLLFRKNNLYHPIYDAHYLIDSLIDKPGAIVNVAKGDWLLMTYDFNEIFFYNPIIKAMVELPNLRYGQYLRSICFSAPPTSKDWRVVAGIAGYDYEIFVYSIKDGEQEWSSCEFVPSSDLEEDFEFSHCNAVIHKGLYYFLGKNAQLLVHNPKTQSFYLYQESKFITQDLKDCGGQEYMIKSDGKLLAVFVNCDGSSICICRWDTRKRKGIKLKSLGKKMLFVSAISSMSERALIKGMGNKIYFPRFVGNHCLFHSLSSKRYHTFEGGSYEDFNIEESKRFPDSIWIRAGK